MVEIKEVNFAYTNQEAVKLLFEESSGPGGFYPFDQDVVIGSIDEMRARGWDNKRILENTIRLDITYRSPRKFPLTQVVYYDHPIIEEWGDKEVRSALYKVAMKGISEAASSLFDSHMELQGPYLSDECYLNRAANLIKFANRLKQEVSSPPDIRNR